MINELKNLGFDKISEIKTENIPFEPSLISLCEMNTCGNYKKSYTCPPLVGKTEELIEKAKEFDRIIVFQKVYPLEDSFDFEGMVAGQKSFSKLLVAAYDLCGNVFDKFLLLGAGGCPRCEVCGAKTDTPCRFPDKKIPSLESYGIQVSTLAAACGMNYINGQNTVTYFGGILI